MPHKSLGPEKMLKAVLSWLKQNHAVLRSTGFRHRLVFLLERRRRCELFRRFFLHVGILTRLFQEINDRDFFTVIVFYTALSCHFIPRRIVVIELLSLPDRHFYPFRDTIRPSFSFSIPPCYVNFVLRVQFPLHSR